MFHSVGVTDVILTFNSLHALTSLGTPVQLFVNANSYLVNHMAETQCMICKKSDLSGFEHGVVLGLV